MSPRLRGPSCRRFPCPRPAIERGLCVHHAEQHRHDYEGAWPGLRAQSPRCTWCGGAGNEVDHIVPIIDAPSRRLDPSNLQTLCKSCHSTKTGGGRKKLGGGITKSLTKAGSPAPGFAHVLAADEVFRG